MFFLRQPEVIELELFSSMPAHYRRDGRRSNWADANRGGRPAHSFLEGPVFDQAGNLYVTDVPWGRVFRIDPRGHWDLVVEYDGEPNGLKFLDDRRLVVADYMNGLLSLDVATGEVRPFLTRRNTERFKGVNDLTFDSQGNLYFTDQGQTGLQDPTGRLYRLRPTGQLEELLSNVPSPNGVVLAPDEQVLYLAATRGNCVWRVPLFKDGGIGKVGQFFTSFGPVGPDGLASDEAGHLFVANPGLGLVWMLDGKAQPVALLKGQDGSSTTNMAFGGADNKTLYVTDSTNGTVLVAALTAPGIRVRRGS